MRSDPPSTFRVVGGVFEWYGVDREAEGGIAMIREGVCRWKSGMLSARFEGVLIFALWDAGGDGAC